MSARMTLGEAIWVARDYRGLTQLELAASLSVSRPHIANIETGRFNPSVRTVEEIARALTCRFSTNGHSWEVTYA